MNVDAKLLDQEVFSRLQSLLVELTAGNINEVTPDSSLDEDLGIDIDKDLPLIVSAINRDLEIELSPDIVYDELEKMGLTVGELAKLVQEEVELG